MPCQNRVTPFGSLIAVPERGSLLGNRGCLHDDAGRLTRRRWTQRCWVTCRLEFKGRRRRLMQPRRYTELFFMDEATAFAAGHRPCGECRREVYRAFKGLWLEVNGDRLPPGARSIGAIDGFLHRERVAGWDDPSLHRIPLADVPDRAFVALADDPRLAWLVAGRRLLSWTPGGYDRVRPRPARETVRLLTPPSVARVFAAGWIPARHPSAERWA